MVATLIRRELCSSALNQEKQKENQNFFLTRAHSRIWKMVMHKHLLVGFSKPDLGFPGSRALV